MCNLSLVARLVKDVVVAGFEIVWMMGFGRESLRAMLVSLERALRQIDSANFQLV